MGESEHGERYEGRSKTHTNPVGGRTETRFVAYWGSSPNSDIYISIPECRRAVHAETLPCHPRGDGMGRDSHEATAGPTRHSRLMTRDSPLALDVARDRLGSTGGRIG